MPRFRRLPLFALLLSCAAVQPLPPPNPPPSPPPGPPPPPLPPSPPAPPPTSDLYLSLLLTGFSVASFSAQAEAALLLVMVDVLNNTASAAVGAFAAATVALASVSDVAAPPPTPPPLPPSSRRALLTAPPPPVNPTAASRITVTVFASYPSARDAALAVPPLTGVLRGQAFLYRLQQEDSLAFCSMVNLTRISIVEPAGAAPAPAPAPAPLPSPPPHRLPLLLSGSVGGSAAFVFLVVTTVCCVAKQRRRRRIIQMYADAEEEAEFLATQGGTGTPLKAGPALVGRRVRLVALAENGELNGVSGIAASFDSRDGGSCVVFLDAKIGELKVGGEMQYSVSRLRMPIQHLELITERDERAALAAAAAAADVVQADVELHQR